MLKTITQTTIQSLFVTGLALAVVFLLNFFQSVYVPVLTRGGVQAKVEAVRDIQLSENN